MAALEDVLEYRYGKGVIGKWASSWFCLQNGQVEQYLLEDGEKRGAAVKIFDLSDANEFEFDAESNSKITLQCGNERVRLRGSPDQMRQWYEKMRSYVSKDFQASQTFQPPARPASASVVSAASTERKESADTDSPRRGRSTRASFFNKPLEHLKSNERLDPSVATTLSKPTQMLLAIWYQLDMSKMRTSDLMRRVDTSGDGEISRSELRKGLSDILSFTCSNDDFKELMKVLDADGSGSISTKEMDRALKRAAKGEDLMIETESEAILEDAMIQVDTVVGIPITADTGDSLYVARGKWKDDEKGKCPKTEARPGRISGPATEDCAIRQQLKLVTKKNSPSVAVLSICRREPDGHEETIGQCMMNVKSEEHHDVHWLKLLDSGGLQTGAQVRLRVKLKVQKPHLNKATSLSRMDSQQSLSPRSPRAPEKPQDPEETQRRFEKMHQLHAEKLQKMEDKRRAFEAQDMQKLQEEAQKLKSKRVKAADLCPRAAADRLYRDSKARMRRKREHQYNHYQEEEENLRKLKQESRQFWSKTLSNAQLVNSETAGNRLHDKAINKQQLMQQKIREKSEAEVKEANEKAARTVKRASSVGTIMPERLYQEAQQHMKMKAEERQKIEAEELKKYHEKLVGSGRSINPRRFEELHLEHQNREQKRALLRDEARKREDDRITNEIELGRQRARLNKDKNNKLSPKSTVPWHERLTQPKGPKPEDPTAKGPTVLNKAQGSTAADFIVDSLLSVLRLRSFSCAPPDRKLLSGPIRGILDTYKQALAQCTKVEGFSSLAARSSLRLYPDGHLLEDSVGWQTVSEPGPIRQVQDDLEQLLATAERAQAMLENLIAPKEKPWRPGEQRQKPSAVPMASFAYSYGVKNMEAARTKAVVQYGPAEGEKRFRHLLDLARISLVFRNCDFLQHGLDLILTQFEVVDVRNGFRNPPRSGERFVEILVILEVEQEDAGEPIPHVCEIRLEEINFYNARVRAEPLVQDLVGQLTQHYKQNPSSMAYLGRWILNSQTQSHGLRVWHKHLAKRFGSAVSAWRQKFGLTRLVTFAKFRDVCCKETKSGPHATEYWQELDIGRGGSISLFELDPQLVCMLAMFRARLLKLAGTNEPSPEELWHRLSLCVNGQLQRPDRMIISEFSMALTRALGFSSTDARLIFDALDSEGGQTCNPPGHVRSLDITWLNKLPILVDLDAVALRPNGFHDDTPLVGSKSLGSHSGALRASPGSPTSPVSDSDSQGSFHEEATLGTPVTPLTPATPATPDPPPAPVAREKSNSSDVVQTKKKLSAEVIPESPEAKESKELPSTSKATPAPQTPSPTPSPTPAKQPEEPEEVSVSAQKSVTLAAEPEVQEMEIDDLSDLGEEGEEEDEEFDVDLSAVSDGHLPQAIEDETF